MSQRDTSDWFLRKLDPAHAPMVVNGVRWEYEDERWRYVIVDSKWRDYWDCQNNLLIAKFDPGAVAYEVASATKKQVTKGKVKRKAKVKKKRRSACARSEVHF